MIIITNLLEISSINANKKRNNSFQHLPQKNSWRFFSRVYLHGLTSQKWEFEKSSKYLAPLVDLQISSLKLFVTYNGNLHGLLLSLKNTPSMHSSVTPGVKPYRKTIPVFPERIIKFTSSKMIFSPLMHNAPQWSGTL